MKKLLVIIILSVSSVSYSACNLQFDVKKDGAKTAYIEGVSVSAKIRTALESKCKIAYNVLTKDEIKQMSIKSLKVRLAKLTATK